MNYISTRGGVMPIGFQDAVLMGLADDGGLIVPSSIPDVTDKLDAWAELDYMQLTMEVLRLFATDIPAGDIEKLVRAAYGNSFSPEVAPIANVGSMYVLELWHGPTMSFKDVALQLLGELFEYILSRRDQELNILGATSGDTGSAAICGVRGRDRINIFMMHPNGRVSDIQQRQMTSVLDDNVHNISIDGTFDDCQRIMKTIAGDLDFKRRYSLGAVNSVNWARVLAQIVYYFHASLALCKKTGARKIRVAVPTGNFGDILAGWFAVQMGAPISQLILATNENDILARFFDTGEYSRGQVHHTLAPAMDIQVASNFERYLFYKVGCDGRRLRELMEQFDKTGSLKIDVSPGQPVDPLFQAGAATTEDVLDAIRRCHQQYDYLLDPHTACGYAVAESRILAPVGAQAGQAADADDQPLLCLSTAHPAKFPAAITQATGADLARHPDIDALADLPTRCKSLPNNPQAVRDFITDTIDK